MIEKRTMGYVDFQYPGIDAKSVAVIYNIETEKVELYRPDDDCNEWYSPNYHDRFYGTVEEANKALEDHKNELIAKMEEVKEYLKTMDEWEPDEDENSPFHFDRRDYLTYSLFRNTYGDDGLAERERQRLNKENKYLKGIIATGFINVRGDSFKVEDIESICWGNDKAELKLKDGHKITTCNETEFNIITLLFGHNISEYTYPRLNDKDDE